MTTRLHHSVRFETQDAWLAHLVKMDSLPCNHDEDPRRDRGSRDSWSGGTYAEARALARSGWQEGAARMAETARAAVRLAQSVARPSVAYDVAGAYPDVPLAVAGDPMCMINIGDEQIATKPTVRLYVEMSASGSVSADKLTIFGAAILSQIDALEAADVRTEVNLVWPVLGEHKKVMQLTIVAKRAQDPLDYERLAFLMTHPAQFRRLVFDVLARDPGFLPAAEHHGLGMPHRAVINDDPEGIIIPSINENTWEYADLKSAVPHIQGILESGLTEIGHPMKFDCLNG